MKSRKLTPALTVIATLVLAATPLTSHADMAMNECIEAFIAQHVPKDRELIVRTFSDAGSATSLRAGRIKLTARGARSGKQVASATCIVDSSRISIKNVTAPVQIAAAAR